uniref:Alpha-carbonic anhydrase domain-containing protein n=1 Tax=Glossina morsitans morsitans TaxID=37546 RepID=A0A1B0G191_GLOMM
MLKCVNRYTGSLQQLLLIFIIINFTTKQAISGYRFGYSESNQKRWARHHGYCAGKTQSPIAVNPARAISLHMPAVDMIGYHNLLPYPLKIINNGHTVSIAIPKLSEEQLGKGEFMPYTSGAKLPGEFEVESIHFHWGDKNNRGAEHVVNDIRYTMEMHIVHRNRKYSNLTEALGYTDGVAVMGFFYNLDEDEGLGLTAISRHLHLVPEAHNEAILNVTFSLSSLISGVDVDKFYTYKGSLTTPPCSEAVTWILYPDPISISAKQISRFRQLYDVEEGALVDNFRQLQPLGNRRIFMRVGHTHHTNIQALISEVDYRKWDWFH